MRYLIIGFSLLACTNDQELKAFSFNDVVVVKGDFDNMNDVLLRLDIGATEYEGFISNAVYDPEIDPSINALKVEGLLRERSESNRTVMLDYDAIFINSGVRGLGEYVYNGVENDNALLEDETVIENVKEFVERGRTLVLSDWAGDLAEAVWPDKIEFVNENVCNSPPCWDSAQVGTSDSVTATIVDEELAKEMDTNTLTLGFDFSYWTAIKSVSEDVEVYLRGDIQYRISDGEGYGVLEDVPLLVGFPEGRGRVVFSSFHWRGQNPTQANKLMLYAVSGLTPGPNANIYGD